MDRNAIADCDCRARDYKHPDDFCNGYHDAYLRRRTGRFVVSAVAYQAGWIAGGNRRRADETPDFFGDADGDRSEDGAKSGTTPLPA